MALDSGALPVANPPDLARGDFNVAMTQLDAAFPLAAANLGTDAVETLKIKDGNVTAPKLAPEVLSNVIVLRPLLYDDFEGSVLDARWTQAGDVGGNAVVDGSVVAITTVATATKKYRIDFNGKDISVFGSTKPKITFKNESISADVEVLFALYKDDDNYVAFRLDLSVSANWKGVTRVGGVETEVDLGVAGGDKVLMIDYVSNALVNFYIEGILEGFSSTNIPNVVDYEIRAEVTAEDNIIAGVELDAIILSRSRL